MLDYVVQLLLTSINCIFHFNTLSKSFVRLENDFSMSLRFILSLGSPGLGQTDLLGTFSGGREAILT
jgi:hypothetical protein